MRLHQKRASASPAEMAPGTIRMNALSTISIVVIESVSDANVRPAARREFDAGPQDRAERERVAEEEREHD